MNTRITKIIAFILSVLMLSYVGYQVYTVIYNPYKTEVVKYDTYSKSVTLDGFIIRDEQVIGGKSEGVISYNYKNAKKVAKDSVIANIYKQESDLYNLKQIEYLTKKLDILNTIKKDNIKGLKLNNLNEEKYKNIFSVLESCDSENLNKLDSEYFDVLNTLTKIDLYTNDKCDINTEIASITGEINKLKKEINPAVSVIKSTLSGSFCNTVDGFESTFTTDKISDLTIDKVNEFLNSKNVNEDSVKSSVGKVQTSPEWYFVSLIDVNDSDTFKVGSEIRLNFTSKSNVSIKSTVYKNIVESGKDKAILILKSNYIDEDLISMRFEKPVATINSYSGIVIPKEAIRIAQFKDDDGNTTSKKGAYVLIGNSVRFKPVDPIYEDKYVLVSRENESTAYITIYDQVIIKGKDLDASTK